MWDLLSAGVTSKLSHLGTEEGGAAPSSNVKVTSLSHHHQQPRLVSAARAELFFWEKQRQD